MPVNYSIGRFTFNFSPSYTLPVNPGIITLYIQPSNGPEFSRTRVEKLSNSFYFVAGLSFQL
jgi:hypothetical protein